MPPKLPCSSGFGVAVQHLTQLQGPLGFQVGTTAFRAPDQDCMVGGGGMIGGSEMGCRLDVGTILSRGHAHLWLHTKSGVPE